MRDIRSLRDKEKVVIGSLIRMYGVSRYDVMKIGSDREDELKAQRDYYDYILVRYFQFPINQFFLINITIESRNRGTILATFDVDPGHDFLEAKVLKNYFGENESVFFLDYEE
jgi:hypothetical protein